MPDGREHEGPASLDEMRRFLHDLLSGLEHRKGLFPQADLESEFSKVRQYPEQFVEEVLRDTVGLGPLEPLLRDPRVREIMVNGPQCIFVERDGRMVQAEETFRDDEHAYAIIGRILTPLGKRVDFGQPMVDARLPDGSRVNVVIPPLSVEGPGITIRKFSEKALTIEDLVRLGSMTEAMARFLAACIRGKLNVIVAGGTGSGKTTMLNVLSEFIPDDERIIVIEDTSELQISKPNRRDRPRRPPASPPLRPPPVCRLGTKPPRRPSRPQPRRWRTKRRRPARHASCGQPSSS
ncbi:MAG: CpaF family protein [Candidatus Riflebacteria bacterium]|nr:CpaF family protein [Candidatus Riflebacteria bacterium]